jgi:hypothetical protein
MDVQILSLLVDEQPYFLHIPCLALCYVQPFSLNVPVTCYYTGILNKLWHHTNKYFECYLKFWAQNTQGVISHLKFWQADGFGHACIVEKALIIIII